MIVPSSFIIRPADVNDIPILAGHRAAMFTDMGQLPSSSRTPLIDATASYLREAMPRGDYLAWVAETREPSSASVGGVGVQLRPILPRPRPGAAELELGPEAIILNVYVEPAWRRRGVGEALVRTVLDALSSRGIRRIVLHASNDGRRLYERLGFAATNEMRLSPAPQGASR
jgi:ribosomal protein S18 acetylase RimI-like enzyme